MRLAGLASRAPEALRTRKLLVVQAALLGGLVGGLIVLHQPERYASSAYVTGSGHVSFARSPRVLAAVLRHSPARGISPSSMSANSRVAARGPGTVEFRVVNPSPGRAEALATNYAQMFASLSGSRRLVVTPAVSAVRVSPKPAGTIVIAVLLGLLGGLVLALTVEGLDRRVRSIDDVEDALGLPMLGIPRPTERKNNLVLLTKPFGEEAESYRVLRANLDSAALDPAVSVIMVTGALDGEGRTTTAANLAITYALEGRVVALADLSLRYPGLARRFGLGGRPGLTDVALGHAPLSSALARFDLEMSPAVERPPMALPGRLDVLPAGPEPVDPSDVIGSAAVTKLINELRHTHELVLLDAPPLLPVSDARELSVLADAMIVVANLSLLRPPLLRELRSAIDACRTVPLGFVATGAPRERHDPYAGYYLARPEAAV
jgi:Mrp family chromosome partitioning ATPase